MCAVALRVVARAPNPPSLSVESLMFPPSTSRQAPSPQRGQRTRTSRTPHRSVLARASNAWRSSCASVAPREVGHQWHHPDLPHHSPSKLVRALAGSPRCLLLIREHNEPPPHPREPRLPVAIQKALGGKSTSCYTVTSAETIGTTANTKSYSPPNATNGNR
jgi:hypothetical protein